MADQAAKYEKIIVEANFVRPAKEILLDLIHVYLNYQIPLNKITFGQAAPLDQRPDTPIDPDSFVQAEIDPEYDYRFPGENGFLYRRIPLGAATVNADMEIFAPEFPFTVHDVLDQVNRFMNLNLQPEDVLDETFEAGAVVFLLRASPNSWVWSGGRVIPMVFKDTLPNNARITADGAPRITTDGSVRIAVGM